VINLAPVYANATEIEKTLENNFDYGGNSKTEYGALLNIKDGDDSTYRGFKVVGNSLVSSGSFANIKLVYAYELNAPMYIDTIQSIFKFTAWDGEAYPAMTRSFRYSVKAYNGASLKYSKDRDYDPYFYDNSWTDPDDLPYFSDYHAADVSDSIKGLLNKIIFTFDLKSRNGQTGSIISSIAINELILTGEKWAPSRRMLQTGAKKYRLLDEIDNDKALRIYDGSAVVCPALCATSHQMAIPKRICMMDGVKSYAGYIE
jgi:hypothetical protein